jgi:23S rRNA (pseudouridine1915-N3)-methyltransferase
MRLHMLCVTKRPRDWVTQATDEYLKRLRGQFEIVVNEISPIKQPSKTTQLEKDAARLRRLCPARACMVALDEHGDPWSTDQLASKLGR